jgi:hypothetical protein
VYFTKVSVNKITGANTMVEYVTLRPTHLELLIDVFQEVIEYKYRALSRHNWTIFERDYLPSVIQSIHDNKFKVVTSADSMFVWIIDQIIHSKKIVDGVPKRDWIPLIDFERTQRCLGVLRAARFGSNSYARYTATNTFTDLFD